MTETLQHLDRRIESAEELHTVTRTMRGLAAVNLRHYEIAAEAAADYELVVEEGLHVALREGRLERLAPDTTAPDAPTGILVFGSNQGLCGPVNRLVVQHAVALFEQVTPISHIGVVGARMAAELELVGSTIDTRWDLPGTVETIGRRAEQVLVRIDAWRAEHEVGRVLMVFPRYLGRTGGYEPVTRQLVPLEREWLERLARHRWRSRVLPVYTRPWDQLVAELIRNAVFVRIHRSFAQTMAAVSASRLVAMDVAQTKLEERLTALRELHHQLRQAEITGELLDVVSGFEVLTGPGAS